jgi:hypothetical protein
MYAYVSFVACVLIYLEYFSCVEKNYASNLYNILR